MDPLSTELIPFVPHPAWRRRKQIRKQKIAKIHFQSVGVPSHRDTTLIALRFHFEFFYSTRISIPDRHALKRHLKAWWKYPSPIKPRSNKFSMFSTLLCPNDSSTDDLRFKFVQKSRSRCVPSDLNVFQRKNKIFNRDNADYDRKSTQTSAIFSSATRLRHIWRSYLGIALWI